jgi:hypothetical protein
VIVVRTSFRGAPRRIIFNASSTASLGKVCARDEDVGSGCSLDDALAFAINQWPFSRETSSIAQRNVRHFARGQSQADGGQAPLEIPRSSKHLMVDLPIGSEEKPYEVGLLTDAGDQLLRATGMPELHDHTMGLRADVDLSSIRPEKYSLGVRQPRLEWTRYPIRVF